MHPLARVFQILFLLSGAASLAFAWSESVDNGGRANAHHRYECKTVNMGTAERPQPREECVTRESWIYLHGTDEVFVATMTGLGLIIAGVAVSVGGARRPSGTPAPVGAPVGVPAPAGGPHPGQQPGQPHPGPHAGPPQGPPHQPPAGPPPAF